LLGNDNKQIGIVSIREAQEKANEAGLDLVEISPNAQPPVVKIVDFRKFKYEEAKKERVARRNTHETETKEIWLGPLISEHDLENRLRRAKEFLEDGDRVKLTVKFSGREMQHPEFGHEVLNKAKQRLSELAEADGEPKFLGRNLGLAFKPTKKH
jgi:translation initiation factor IF-3